jgi:hypothetical protein
MGMYPDEMYAEQERRQADWARDDAMRAMREALNFQRRGNTQQSLRFEKLVHEKICEAEYHEGRI